MASRGMTLTDLLNAVKDKDPKDKDRRKVKNDLLSEKNDVFSEINRTFELIQAFGFSKKTVKMTAKLNLNLRQKLNLDNIDYFIVVIALQLSKPITCNTITGMIRESSFSSFQNIFNRMFNLFDRNIFSLLSAPGEILFYPTTIFRDFVQTNEGEFCEDKIYTLKKFIIDVDLIANLYNSPISSVVDMGEKHILNLLYHHIDEYEYAATLVEIYEKCVMAGNCDYKFLFYILGHLILNSHECPSIDKNHDLIDMFAAHIPQHEEIICNIFENDKHMFFQEKIFDHAIDESGKADKNAVELHANFKRTYVKNLIVERKHDDIIKNAKIIKKPLFFNPNNKEKIDELTDMLSTKRFNSIKTRLKKAGTRTGFIILFSGYPGTGKTELAMQLAKKTGRDILKVDMSQIRSKWWGEDERNVKAIFSNYKSIMQDSKLEPILLLNEADALIGKRLDVSGNNGAIISSINATQNIILDAFDEFEGICIATTNLTTNFDSAFERRFLYKIEFEKPNNEVRAQILTTMLKIPENDALKLAKEFDLSGANIENIYRKMKTKEVLYGTQYNIETLRGLCKDEKIEKEHRLGFGNV